MVFWVKPLERWFAKLSAQRAAALEGVIPIHPHAAIRRGALRAIIRRCLFPTFMKYYRIPTERSAAAQFVGFCRRTNIMVDDNQKTHFPLFQRAYDLMPLDLKRERERRLCLAGWLVVSQMDQPVETQNFDPFVPYLAPYVEEARFQLQEEEELLGYHPWHRKWFQSERSGFGEREKCKRISSLIAF